LKKPRPFKSLASVLDDPFSLIESADDDLSASDNDICRCGATRKEHEGPEGLVEAGKCKKFREAL